MKPVDINGTKIKVGDVVQSLITDKPFFTEGFLYRVVDTRYNLDGECDVIGDNGEQTFFGEGEFELVHSVDISHNETSGELDPPLFVDDNGKVIKDNLEDTTSNPLKVQYGGTHYKDKTIQPIEYILANDLNFCEGNAIKYLTRWRDKGGVEDLKKAKHYIDFLIEKEESNGKT